MSQFVMRLVASGLNVIIRSARNVVWSEFHGGVSILSLESQRYFRLEGVGHFLWFQLQTARSVSELASALANEYEMDLEICVSDVREFADSLFREGLIDKDLT